MPELAAVYSVGLVACLSLTGFFVFLWSRRRESAPFLTLNADLAKVGLYWAESLDQIVHLTAEIDKREQNSSRKTIVTTGLFLCLLSWVGVFFLFLIMLSYRFLARSRMEKLLFSSPLALDPALPNDQIESWLRKEGFQLENTRF